jgi:hypothetical protein
MSGRASVPCGWRSQAVASVEWRSPCRCTTRAIAVVEERAPDGFVDLDAVISREELEEIARSYKRTAGFDPEALNNRPSLAVRQHAAHAATSRP